MSVRCFRIFGELEMDEEEYHSSQHYFYRTSFLLGGLLVCLIMCSGCFEQQYYGIGVELLSEEDLADYPYYNQSFVDITHWDFSMYPTLSQAISLLIDPLTNKTSVLLETSKEEWDRIRSDIGSYFTYPHYYFTIAYALS